MNEQHNKLVFDVNESLLFEKGQEIEEMISISLDPDIVVQTYDDYIQIRGVILLQGEFIKKEQDSHDTTNLYHPALRYVEHVIDQGDRIAQFSHRFPVEISVPLYRVNDLDQIAATIDSFDYEIVTDNKMNIIASLHIYGIDQAAPIKNHRDELDDFDHRKDRRRENKPDKEESISRSSSEQPFDDRNVQKEKVLAHDSARLLHDEAESDVRESNERPSERRETNKEETSNREAEGREVERSLQHDSIDEAHLPERLKTQKNRHNDDLSDSLIEEAYVDDNEEEMEIQLTEHFDDEDDTVVEDVTFLTELFQENEESYTKVKIYIAQENDTVESIAKRYEVPILQLIKDNELMEDSIQGGQLIKIIK